MSGLAECLHLEGEGCAYNSLDHCALRLNSAPFVFDAMTERNNRLFGCVRQFMFHASHEVKTTCLSAVGSGPGGPATRLSSSGYEHLAGQGRLISTKSRGALERLFRLTRQGETVASKAPATVSFVRLSLPKAGEIRWLPDGHDAAPGEN